MSAANNILSRLNSFHIFTSHFPCNSVLMLSSISLYILQVLSVLHDLQSEYCMHMLFYTWVLHIPPSMVPFSWTLRMLEV